MTLICAGTIAKLSLQTIRSNAGWNIATGHGPPSKGACDSLGVGSYEHELDALQLGQVSDTSILLTGKEVCLGHMAEALSGVC